MTTTKTPGRVWPTHEQLLLLKAALLDPPNALAPWRAWKASVDVDHLDLASYRLVPLVYWNLRGHEDDDAALAKARAAYQRTWLENETCFRQTAGVVQALHRAGIRMLLLKGAALTLAHYEDQGLRPMVDFDVLVPDESAARASDIISTMGWVPEPRRAPHAITFTASNSREIDLHWRALMQSCGPHADDEFWRAAIRSEFRGVPVEFLCPADQLLHLCVHGAVWSPSPPLRWITDAMIVLRREPALDWDRLLEQVRRHRVALTVAIALEYLREVFDAPIPELTIRRMRALPISVLERIDYATETVAPYSRGVLFGQWWSFRYYVRWAIGGGGRPSVLGYLRHLQYEWRIAHLWQLPLSGVASAFRRVGRILRHGWHAPLNQARRD